MTKTPKTNMSRPPVPLDRVVRDARDLERIAIMAQAALRLPPGSAVQTQARAETDRALRALKRNRRHPA